MLGDLGRSQKKVYYAIGLGLGLGLGLELEIVLGLEEYLGLGGCRSSLRCRRIHTRLMKTDHKGV